MSADRAVLLVDVGAEPMGLLADQIRRLGFRALRTKSVEEGVHALTDPRYAMAAALVPPDLPSLDLERSLLAFREAQPDGDLPLLLAGPEPAGEDRERMRRAGVRLALWSPWNDADVRFQLNRALAGDAIVSRRRFAERVPADLAVRLRVGSREKDARVYSLSARGAFLSTSRPSLPRTLLHLSLPLPERDLPIAARVVMTNVPGNLACPSLPSGMGIRFTGQHPDADQHLRTFTETRARELVV